MSGLGRYFLAEWETLFLAHNTVIIKYGLNNNSMDCSTKASLGLNTESRSDANSG
jgi:hypothetical protein